MKKKERLFARWLGTIGVAVACVPTVAAGVTKTCDNSEPVSILSWFSRPLFKRHQPRAPEHNHCPPYFSETHGYVRPQWRPWSGELGKPASTTTTPTTPAKPEKKMPGATASDEGAKPPMLQAAH